MASHSQPNANANPNPSPNANANRWVPLGTLSPSGAWVAEPVAGASRWATAEKVG